MFYKYVWSLKLNSVWNLVSIKYSLFIQSVRSTKGLFKKVNICVWWYSLVCKTEVKNNSLFCKSVLGSILQNIFPFLEYGGVSPSSFSWDVCEMIHWIFERVMLSWRRLQRDRNRAWMAHLTCLLGSYILESSLSVIKEKK